jgi:endoglucanase
MKLFSSFLLAFYILLFALIGCSNKENLTAKGDSNPDIVTPTYTNKNSDSDISIPGTIRDISSMDLVAEMGIGWNLGNSLDVENTDKTDWGNPLPSQAIIDKVYAIGFRTLRVPVTWSYHQQASAPYTIDQDYLAQAQETVNYGISKGMHVIVNIHHDNTWIRPTNVDAPTVKPRVASLWTQLANRFKTYGDKLIFETLNENRLLNSPKEWSGGTAEGRAVLNEYHLEALNAIRATGGNNTGRHIMISTYAASTVPVAMDGLVIPNNDPRTIISLHTYSPWPFCGPEDTLATWGSDEDKAQLAQEFDRIHQKWVIEEGRPIILGEWGAVDKSNLNVREEYYNFYVSESTERGLLPVVWDDGGNFRMLDRANLTWHFQSLAETIIEAEN